MAPKREMHPNSLANLMPAWEKGQSGNPRGVNGWTAGTSRAEEDRRLGRLDTLVWALNTCEDSTLAQAAMEHICEAIIEGAIAGDRRLLKRLLDRIWLAG